MAENPKKFPPSISTLRRNIYFLIKPYKGKQTYISIYMKLGRCKYICNTCNKEYSSYKSLWKHNKVFHGGQKDDDKKITTSLVC